MSEGERDEGGQRGGEEVKGKGIGGERNGGAKGGEEEKGNGR